MRRCEGERAGMPPIFRIQSEQNLSGGIQLFELRTLGEAHPGVKGLNSLIFNRKRWAVFLGQVLRGRTRESRWSVRRGRVARISWVGVLLVAGMAEAQVAL